MRSPKEISLKGFILAILLSFILAVSNAYLALKIGILLSASIPAAIISMGVLRLFNQSNILENNLVQTAASAGEAVAGGIVYTIPALIIIQYWTGFSYWENFLIALLGGVLGIMFSIPLRRVLMEDKKLKFPEGRAIASVLQVTHKQQVGIKDVLYGCLISALLELGQTGVKLVASAASAWVKVNEVVIGFGLGFSPAMIGAGYLIGIQLTSSIMLGAILSWLVSIPLLSYLSPDVIANHSASEAAQLLWGDNTRYIGIGAMLAAGLFTLLTLFKPILSSIRLAFSALSAKALKHVDSKDKDIPIQYVILISIISVTGLYLFYSYLLPLEQLGLSSLANQAVLYSVLFYTVVGGFLFCIITAYFSGMVGVSASPGSSIVIAALLTIAFAFFIFLHQYGYTILTPTQIKACEAITIICTAVITGMAAISNDNIQDLKVGYLLGATPWKQEAMLLVGVICASLVIAPVMQLLYNVYGIAGVMPREGMDAALSLPAPPAAAMATLSGAVLHQQVPWNMLIIGAVIILVIQVLNACVLRHFKLELSVLGVAIGIYLPFSSSTALFLGGFMAWLLRKSKKNESNYHDVMFACGLIAGASLLDVILAIPLSILKDPNALSLAPAFWQPIGVILSFMALAIIYMYFKRRAF